MRVVTSRVVWCLISHKNELKDQMLEQPLKSNICCSIQFLLRGVLLILLGSENVQFSIYLFFWGVDFFWHWVRLFNYFELQKLLPEIQEKYKVRMLHFQKQKNVVMPGF